MHLHHIEIFNPDGIGRNSRVFLDGRELIGVHSVTTRVAADELTTVTLVLEAKVDCESQNEANTNVPTS